MGILLIAPFTELEILKCHFPENLLFNNCHESDKMTRPSNTSYAMMEVRPLMARHVEHTDEIAEWSYPAKIAQF
jgi:hypothetical protein